LQVEEDEWHLKPVLANPDVGKRRWGKIGSSEKMVNRQKLGKSRNANEFKEGYPTSR